MPRGVGKENLPPISSDTSLLCRGEGQTAKQTKGKRTSGRKSQGDDTNNLAPLNTRNILCGPRPSDRAGSTVDTRHPRPCLSSLCWSSHDEPSVRFRFDLPDGHRARLRGPGSVIALPWAAVRIANISDISGAFFGVIFRRESCLLS